MRMCLPYGIVMLRVWFSIEDVRKITDDESFGWYFICASPVGSRSISVEL